MDMHRIRRLRAEVLKNNVCYDEFFYKFYKHYSNMPEASSDDRYADAFYCALSNMTPCISDDELIAGKPVCKMSSSEESEWKNTYKPMAMEESKKAGGGQDSHMSIDYDTVLKFGVSGLIEKINTYLSKCDESQKDFYTMCKKCLEAVIAFSENYADEAFRLSEQTSDLARKNELIKISEICRKVPLQPAESFYEAVQSVHFITFCVSMNPLRFGHQQFQLGHPDRYLLPYYLNDIKNGVITKEYAQLLLDCLGIQINNRVPNGLSSGYMVGGRDENNNIVQNELTLMCMKVIDDIRLVYPAVGLCYTEGMDDVYLEEACRILSLGCSHPAIFNDDIISKGLQCYGVPPKESHSYVHSTCVEITPEASSNVWVASPYTNMAQCLLDILDREYSSFDDLMKCLFENIDSKIKINFEHENSNRLARSLNSCNPLLSCFVNDCLDRGVDIEQGGAKYNWIMPSFVGVANLVDSLYALKQIVFENKEFTCKKIKTIVDNNFENNELLRQRLLNTIPKYGNDIEAVDCLFGKITEHIISECKKYKGMHSSGDLIPSVFCWIMHERLGKETGATPDGRKAGFPLGDGSGPCQGREMNGPTASVLSSTKWDHHKLIGGVAVNMKFSKSMLGQGSQNAMKVLIKTYMQRGGFEIQINVTDKETLEKAILTPDKYRDLVVRIGGYSDYFVTLSHEMQQEVLLRTEHRI